MRPNESIREYFIRQSLEGDCDVCHKPQSERTEIESQYVAIITLDSHLVICGDCSKAVKKAIDSL